MIIKKTRIRNINKYLNFLDKNEFFYVGTSYTNVSEDKLFRVGFKDLITNEKVLPSIFGNISEYNAEGKEVPQKNKPLETAYRQTEWTWKDWGGNEHSKIADVPYERYPRKFFPPPSIELQIIDVEENRLVIAAKKLIYNEQNYEIIKHIINLFLEIFGECNIYNNKLLPIILPNKTIRLNWDILPEGEHPWKVMRKHIDPIIRDVGKGNKPVVYYRLKEIRKHKPDFQAIGRAGFRGYVIFGFKNKGLYILESIYYGNATYIFEEDWKRLSQKTKAEILNEDLQKDRIIHRENWEKRIKKVLA